MRQVLVQIVETGRIVHADESTARAWVAEGYATYYYAGPVPTRLYGTQAVETR